LGASEALRRDVRVRACRVESVWAEEPCWGRGKAALDEFMTTVYAHERVQQDNTRANRTG